MYTGLHACFLRRVSSRACENVSDVDLGGQRLPQGWEGVWVVFVKFSRPTLVKEKNCASLHQHDNNLLANNVSGIDRAGVGCVFH